MKKILLSTLILFVTSEIFAQLELGAHGGWLWTGRIPAWLQDIKVSDEGNYGITAGYQIREEMLVNFEWNHTENKATFREYLISGGLGDVVTTPLTLNYYMLGFNYLVTFNEPLVPYGLINLGILHSKSEGFNNVSGDSNTWFTAGLGGGLRYYLSDRVGIKLQARLLLPMQFGGVGFGCGIGTGGGGCGAGVSTYTNIIQGDFTGGIVLKLGE
ncbi:MAG: porin family protein [Cytophagales bacterium]|nr:porin family protein [Cytophagales bacterium]